MYQAAAATTMTAAAMATIATVEAATITRPVSPRVGRRNPILARQSGLLRCTACFRIEGGAGTPGRRRTARPNPPRTPEGLPRLLAEEAIELLDQDPASQGRAYWALGEALGDAREALRSSGTLS
jgi:hypothetical protein